MNQLAVRYSRLRSKRSLFRIALVVTICLFATGQFRRSRYPRYDALINAIDRKDANALKAELDRGTNPDAYPDDRDSLYAEEGITPLNYAIDKGDYESVKVLLDYRANPQLRRPVALQPASHCKRPARHCTRREYRNRATSCQIWGGAIGSSLYL